MPAWWGGPVSEMEIEAARGRECDRYSIVNDMDNSVLAPRSFIIPPREQKNILISTLRTTAVHGANLGVKVAAGSFPKI